MLKTVLVFSSILIVITSVCPLAARSGWDEGLFLPELAVGIAVGAGVGYGVWEILDEPGNDESLNGMQFFYVPFAIAAGSTLGVVFFGDSVGARPENPGATLLLPLAASMGTAGLSILSTAVGSVYTYIAVAGVITPLLTAVVYNSVKKPMLEEKATGCNFTVLPYASALADSRGKVVPTYGFELGL